VKWFSNFTGQAGFFCLSPFPPARHCSRAGEAGGEERERTQSACGVFLKEECHFLPFFRKGKE